MSIHSPHHLTTILIIDYYTQNLFQPKLSINEFNQLTILCLQLIQSKTITTTLHQYLQNLHSNPLLTNVSSLTQHIHTHVTSMFTQLQQNIHELIQYINLWHNDRLIDYKQTEQAVETLYGHKLDTGSVYGQYIHQYILSLYSSTIDNNNLYNTNQYNHEFDCVMALYDSVILYLNDDQTTPDRHISCSNALTYINYTYNQLQQSMKQCNLSHSLQYMQDYHDILQRQQQFSTSTSTHHLSDVQYNMLHLCQLQLSYNLYPLSIQSLIECIALAQQSNDHTCLHYALHTLTQISYKLNHVELTQQCIHTSITTSKRLYHDIELYQQWKLQSAANSASQPMTPPVSQPIPLLDAMALSLSARLSFTCSTKSAQYNNILYSNQLCVNNQLYDQYYVNHLVEAYASSKHAQPELYRLSNQLVLHNISYVSDTIRNDIIINVLLNQCMCSTTTDQHKRRIVEHINTHYSNDLSYLQLLQLYNIQFTTAYDQYDQSACNTIYEQYSQSISLHHTELQYNNTTYIDYCITQCKLHYINEQIDNALEQLIQLNQLCSTQPHCIVQQITVLLLLSDIYIDQQCAMYALQYITQCKLLCNKYNYINYSIQCTIRLSYIQLYILYSPLHALNILQNDYVYIIQYCDTNDRQLADSMLHECYQQLK